MDFLVGADVLTASLITDLETLAGDLVAVFLGALTDDCFVAAFFVSAVVTLVTGLVATVTSLLAVFFGAGITAFLVGAICLVTLTGALVAFLVF